MSSDHQIVADAFAAWSAGTGYVTSIFAPDMRWEIVGRSAVSKRYDSTQQFLDEVLHPFGARFSADSPFRPVNIRAIYADDEQRTVAVVWDGEGTAARLGRPTTPWMARLFGPGVGQLKLVPGGRLDWLVGGTPSELPERYAELSPLHRVHPGCPPTLLVHGEHDQMAPVAAMRRLEQVGVPVTGVPTPDRPRLRPGGHRLVTAGPHGHPRPGALPGHPGRHRPTSRSPVRTPRAHPMSQQQADGESEGRPSIEGRDRG